MSACHLAWVNRIKLHGEGQIQYLLCDATSGKWHIQKWELRVGNCPPEEQVIRVACYVKKRCAITTPTRLMTSEHTMYSGPYDKDGEPDLREGYFPMGRPLWQYSFHDSLHAPTKTLSEIVWARQETLLAKRAQERMEQITHVLYYGASAYMLWLAREMQRHPRLENSSALATCYLAIFNVLSVGFCAAFAGNIEGFVSQCETLEQKVRSHLSRR